MKRVLTSGSMWLNLKNSFYLYQRQGKLDEAKEIYEDIVPARGRIFGRDDKDTLASISNLALVLWRQDNLDEERCSMNQIGYRHCL